MGFKSAVHSGQLGVKSGTDFLYGGLIQPEQILPSQYFSRSRGGAEADGELKLMLAVLKDGINCLLNEHDPKEFILAREWVQDRNRFSPFSFDNLCEAVGIEPQPLRTRLESLLRLRQQAGADSKWPVYFSRSLRRPKVVRSGRVAIRSSPRPSGALH